MDLSEQTLSPIDTAKEDPFAGAGEMISPLAKDLTFGEKKYDRIFNFDINFMVNLLSSAAFTTWMSHARTPIKLPFAKEKIAPYMIQKKWAEGISKLPIMQLFGDKTSAARISVSKTMAGILSLTFAGHFVMIPSVWLGSKFKSQLVNKWDREHYGEDAQEDPSLKLRHAMVAAEERPTLLGAVLGRLGTIFATQFTGYTVGNGNNIPSLIGRKCNIGFLKNFKGLDYFTELMGSKVGSVVTEVMPKSTEKVNTVFRNKQYGWSNIQLDTHPELNGLPYGTTTEKGYGGGIPEHFGRNLVADILYTIVTASTISPAINFLKKYIPGITYKPEVSEENQRILADAARFRPRPVRPFTIRDEVPDLQGQAANENRESANENSHTPQFKVSAVQHQAPLAAHPEQHIAHAG